MRRLILEAQMLEFLRVLGCLSSGGEQLNEGARFKRLLT
ncbi:hypothetical protein MnTg02_03423 [bacterium MnTg02]|nr:hypothetical protein MnTg02_03423 [bacterium MnTg02]